MLRKSGALLQRANRSSPHLPDKKFYILKGSLIVLEDMTLQDLNKAVTTVANYLVRKVCSETSELKGTVDISAIDPNALDYLVEGDTLASRDFQEYVLDILRTRSEVTNVARDPKTGEVTLYVNGKYCPHMFDRLPGGSPVLPVLDDLAPFRSQEVLKQFCKGACANEWVRRQLAMSLEQHCGTGVADCRALGLIDPNAHIYQAIVSLTSDFSAKWFFTLDDAVSAAAGQEAGAYPIYIVLGEDPFDSNPLGKVLDSSGKFEAFNESCYATQDNPEYATAMAEAQAAALGFGNRGKAYFYVATKDQTVDEATTQSNKAGICNIQSALDSFDALGKLPGKSMGLKICFDSGQFNQVPLLIQEGGVTRYIGNDYAKSHPVDFSRFEPICAEVIRHTFPKHTIQINNWLVRAAFPGEKMGECLDCVNESDKVKVEFLDTNFKDKDYCPDGQSTGGAYYLDSLLGKGPFEQHEDNEWPEGLCLAGDVRAWTVSPEDMRPINSWLKERNAEFLQQKRKRSLQSKIEQASGQKKALTHERQRSFER